MSNRHYNRDDKRLVKLSDGRVVGWIEGDTFIRPVVGSRHQLRQPPAWAIDAEAFDKEIKPQATLFRVKDSETNTIYEVSTDYLDQHKGELDRGFGRQYFLPLSQWKVKPNGNGSKQLSLWDETNEVQQ